MRGLALVGLLLVAVATVQLAAAELDDDGYHYVPREDGEEHEERGEHSMDDSSRSSGGSGSGGSTFDPSKELAKMSKDDQLMVLEDALEDVRKSQVRPALDRLSRITDLHAKAKANSGWIKSSAEKQRIYSLEAELNQASGQLAKAQSKEMEIYNSMKPLYGIISYQFMQEQQVTIQGSLKKMNKIAYDNAWWSSVFNSGRAESLQDLVVQFFMNWLMTYVIMYPFATAYYAFWSAPWSIYAYSSGASDVVPGVLAWLAGTTIMVLPLAALGVGAYLVLKKFGPELARKAEEAKRQRQYQQTQQYERLTQQRRQFDDNQRARQQQARGAGVGALD